MWLYVVMSADYGAGLCLAFSIDMLPIGFFVVKYSIVWPLWQCVPIIDLYRYF